MRIVAVLLVSLALVTAVAARATAATIRVVDVSPASVEGRGFYGRELVRVTLRTRAFASTARVRASATGRLTATFPRATLDSCTGWTVTAVGASGSRATLKVMPQPACPPPAP